MTTTAPLRPAGRVAALLRLVDRAIEDEISRLAARTGPGEELACTRGCAACCTFAVGTTTPEAVRVADAVERLPRAVKRATLERLAAWEREWRVFETGAGDQLAVASAGGHDALVARDTRWNARRKACPFLDLTTHVCRVYDARPTACRAHHACRVPPAVMALGVDPRGRAIRQPGDGCFTTAEDAALGQPPGVWQLRSDLMDASGEALTRGYAALGTVWAPCVLPVGVAAAGRRRHGWTTPTTPASRAPVPTLRASFPRGGRRRAQEAPRP